jgi:hypothetical protein
MNGANNWFASRDIVCFGTYGAGHFLNAERKVFERIIKSIFLKRNENE